MTHVLTITTSHVSYRNSAANLIQTIPVITFCPSSSYSMPHTVFLVKSFTPTKSLYVEPVQGLNLIRRYISGFEPQVPVTYNYNPSALIISILPHNVIAVHHTQGTHPNRPCHCTVTLRSALEGELKYRLCK